MYSPVIAPETPTLVSEKVPVMPVMWSAPGVEPGETHKVPEVLIPFPANEKLN